MKILINRRFYVVFALLVVLVEPSQIQGTQSSIKFTLIDGKSNESFKVKVGKSVVKFEVKVEANPSDPTLKWFKDNVLLSNSIKHRISNSPTMSVLEIYDIAREDTGSYTLVGTSGKITEELKLTLMVIEKPEVSIRPEPPMFKKGEQFRIKCDVEGCPASNITWKWILCGSPKCDDQFITLTVFSENLENKSEIQRETSSAGCHVQSALSGTALKTGYYKCFAENELGSHEEEAPLFINEFEQAFGISSSAEEIYEGMKVVLSCHASLYKYSQITWLWVDKNSTYQPNIVTNTSNIFVRPSDSEYSFITDVIINSTVQESSGDYICQTKFRHSNKWEEKRFTVNVKKTFAPRIVKTNLNNTKYTVFKEVPFKFICKTVGTPPPQINWYFNGKLIQDLNASDIQFLKNNSQLYIARTLPRDSGLYACEAVNWVGSDGQTATLKVLNLVQADGSSRVGSMEILFVVSLIVIVVGGVILCKTLSRKK